MSPLSQLGAVSIVAQPGMDMQVPLPHHSGDVEFPNVLHLTLHVFLHFWKSELVAVAVQVASTMALACCHNSATYCIMAILVEIINLMGNWYRL